VLELSQTAALVGHYAWFERRLFEIAGGWVRSVVDPAELEAKLLFAEQANHHAWHAELWHQRLPELCEMGRDALTVSPSEAFSGFVDTLAAQEATVERLTGLSRVAVPRLLVALDAHAAMASPVADASLLRTIRIVRSDLLDDWLAGERVLRSLLVGEAQIRRAAGLQADLDALPDARIPLG